MNTKLEDAVIQLHNLARLIEEEIGKGTLAHDIRACADKLNVLIKPMKVKEQA
jgi:hypothetical protein